MAYLANVNKLEDIYLYEQHDILSMFVSKNGQQQFFLTIHWFQSTHQELVYISSPLSFEKKSDLKKMDSSCFFLLETNCDEKGSGYHVRNHPAVSS